MLSSPSSSASNSASPQRPIIASISSYTHTICRVGSILFKYCRALETIDGGAFDKITIPLSFTILSIICLTNTVLPVPGGPYSKYPRRCKNPYCLNIFPVLQNLVISSRTLEISESLKVSHSSLRVGCAIKNGTPESVTLISYTPGTNFFTVRPHGKYVPSPIKVYCELNLLFGCCSCDSLFSLNCFASTPVGGLLDESC